MCIKGSCPKEGSKTESIRAGAIEKSYNFFQAPLGGFGGKKAGVNE
jgi:hypothetical protein